MTVYGLRNKYILNDPDDWAMGQDHDDIYEEGYCSGLSFALDVLEKLIED
ncbi:MAG: hypothetical protein A4E25_00048 [Methanobacterium sp. PtaB.Bin024]|nr:MAG: hypothetical protein A4E25_00048 [Methanobacterium sp. PtaB.Bin024]